MMEVRKNEPMSRHTTFRAGGPADLFLLPETAEELLAAVERYSGEMDVRVIGNGSNLLVSDAGFRGAVISTERLCSVQSAKGVDGSVCLTAGAGILLSKLASEALRAGLSGLESASGIPGSLGGAVVMNAGAYGFEMKDIVSRVRVLTREGELLWVGRDAMKFSYRHSSVPENGWIVVEAELSLTPGDSDVIRERMEELAARRREKQPLSYPSAGSTFKRPAGHFAGQLIEEAGLKGFSLGGAQVSEKHAGFVINRDGASAAQIYALCQEVKRRVLENSGVRLELEVQLLGEFDGTEEESESEIDHRHGNVGSGEEHRA